MTKTMLIPATVLGAAAIALSGCYHAYEEPPPPAYGYYNAPPPAYGGYYYGPSASFGFYGYHDEDDWHHGDGD